jgi:hypothetical protein
MQFDVVVYAYCVNRTNLSTLARLWISSNSFHTCKSSWMLKVTKLLLCQLVIATLLILNREG